MHTPYIPYILLVANLFFVGCRVESEDKAWSSLQGAIHTAFPEVPQLTTAELAAWLQDPARQPPLLLDTRTPEEFKVSHLQGALLAPRESNLNTLLRDYPKDQPIVTYCSVGYRSSATARVLKEAGFTRVHNLQGSLFQWFNEGRPVVRDGRPVTEVHPYNRNWGRFLKKVK